MTDLSKITRRTPLYDIHIALGARIVPFAGWEMPMQYLGILDEVRAVRSKVGLFDVSHMGRIEIIGKGASAFLNRLFSSAVPSLGVGLARYGVICTEDGGIIDDCILYRLAQDRFLLVSNASNTYVVLEWLNMWIQSDDEVRVEEITDFTSMIALQGPDAASLLTEMTTIDLSKLRAFCTRETTIQGSRAIVARTGYTGEYGFEIMLDNSVVFILWKSLIDAGATPCGLGARDVLRLEAGLLLHGNDIDLTTNPYEAGMHRFIDPDREDYIAGESLRSIRDQGFNHMLVGFKMIGRGIARHGHHILAGNEQIGQVSSGSYSPTLDTNIGLGYVATRYSAPGTRFSINIRGRVVQSEVATLPFYSRR